jgi:radical SAM protein with 4Fe4S-binding SPASM domain
MRMPPRSKEDKEEFLNITREKFRTMVETAEPRMCWFELTRGCDMDCKLCFADSAKPLENELNTQEVYRAVGNLVEAGTEAIAFAGGEPTLREDLPQVISYAAREKQMFVAINTDGQRLADRKYVDSLAEAGLQRARVSIDGMRESHDWNRGKGSFDKCVQALRNCADAGIPNRMIISTITQMNYKEVPQLVELAISLDADTFMLPLIPLGRGKEHRELMLTREQTREWHRSMYEMQQVYGVMRVQFEDRCIITEKGNALKVACDPKCCGDYNDSPVGCTAGLWQIMVSADGKVYTGDVITPEHEICDLRKQKLKDVWHKSVTANLLRDRDNLKGKCGRCEFRYVCGGCRRQAFAATGDILASDPQCWYEPSGEDT